jgi:hypothetical protein
MKSSNSRKDVRATISLQPVVMQWAEEAMALGGHNNFSAFVADLIRRHREKSLVPAPPAADPAKVQAAAKEFLARAQAARKTKS